MPNKSNQIAEPEGFDALIDVEDYVPPADPVEEVFKEPVTPDMDPANPRWNPRKYFAAQPKVIVVVKRTDSDILSDPMGTREVKQPVSINGYTLNIVKGRPTKVPRDFASHLVDIGAADYYADIPDAQEL